VRVVVEGSNSVPGVCRGRQALWFQSDPLFALEGNANEITVST